MVKKSKKSKSKRVPLKKKYKILKKVKDHQKKKAKEAKKQLKTKKNVPEKDPGIPVQWPFREQELANLEKRRQVTLDAIEQKKQEKKERAALRKTQILETEQNFHNQNFKNSSLENLAKEAKKRGREFEKNENLNSKKNENSELKANSSQNKTYYRELKKVIELSDVIIQVLDARDPLGCRCIDIEKLILKSGYEKRIILLLNKIDLVPRQIAEKWLKYLREELPTIAFKCNTQSQKSNLGHKKLKFSKRGNDATSASESASSSSPFQTNECLGADNLIQLLKNYCRNQKLKTSITVGVIGLPNVGKSSLINSLKRTKVVQVGSTPGVTRSLQEIHLDKNVKLLDCPGVVFSSKNDNADVAATLRNAIKIEKIEDPVTPVQKILELCDVQSLMSVYKIPKFADVDEFIRQVASNRGKLKKGGIIDTLSAARLVLKDWNEGRIPFYTLPPPRASMDNSHVEFVTEWAKEFNIDEVLVNEESKIIAELDNFDEKFTKLSSNSPAVMDVESLMKEDEEEEEEEEDEEDEDEDEEGGEEEVNEMDTEDTLPVPKSSETMRGKQFLKQNDVLYDAEGIFNPHSAKNEKKKRKKQVKELMKNAMDAEEEDADYDFNTDYKDSKDMVEGDEMDEEEEDDDEEEDEDDDDNEDEDEDEEDEDDGMKE